MSQNIEAAERRIRKLQGHIFDVIDVSDPGSSESRAQMIKIVSKLSPLVGNLIEIHLAPYLNSDLPAEANGFWVRQDPGFPDLAFVDPDSETGEEGFEVKAWFPLATEITARFKDSQSYFLDRDIRVAMPAWIPSSLYYGQPLILDTVITPAIEIAKSRDDHYFRPPDYLVIEPEDTAERTQNLQQSNTSGYRLQIDAKKDPSSYQNATKRAKELGLKAGEYTFEASYQKVIKQMMSEFPYRLDTNYAKMDRIENDAIEAFKSRTLLREFDGHTLQFWQKLFLSEIEVIRAKLEELE